MPLSKRRRRTLLWSPRLAHPFESDASLLVKLAWINEASYMQFQAFQHSIRENWGAAHTAVHANMPSEWPLLVHPLAKLLPRDEFSICLDCLQAGFHSDLPQLLGMETCPIHACPFQRRCTWCGNPIQFGRPEFRTTSIYVCRSCRKSLSPEGTTFLASIRRLSDERILAAFGPFLAGLTDAKRKCDGYWHVHKGRANQIYYYMTGYCSTFTNRLLLPSAVLRNLSVVDYMLPVEPNQLESELDRLMNYDSRWLSNAAAREQGSADPKVRTPIVKFVDDAMDYWCGTDPVKGAIAVREQLRHYMAGSARVYPVDYLLPRSLILRAECYRQLRQIIASSALYQIFKQLRYAELIAAFLLSNSTAGNPDASTEWKAALARRMGNYTDNVIYCDRVRLRTDITSWIPDFQFQPVGEMLRLRVFRLGGIPTSVETTTGPANHH
ncbi:hypothetical protein [Herbaspirillum sp. ST 5-3]|uniref:hypothetical protein n=1 Tax=Oxalobacteraceae TaxID=75682 RepID=UPI0010A4963E|nr:hypothetical protein [Herbaspirillum sp. ST 5-3]